MIYFLALYIQIYTLQYNKTKKTTQKCTIMSNYSERISRLLAEKSLTLADFCKKIGLNSTTTIAKIVSENRKPSSKTIGRIINAYPNISYEWLTTGRGDMKTGSGQTTNNLPESLSGNDDLTVTAKQIINQLDINSLHYTAMLEKKVIDDRDYHNSITEVNNNNHDKNIASLLKGYKSLENRLETKLQEVETEVTKQIIAKLDHDNINYREMLSNKLKDDRDYYDNESNHVKNISNILEGFKTLEIKVETYSKAASNKVVDQMSKAIAKQNELLLEGYEKITSLENDLEDIKTYMAANFELDKMSKKKSKKIKRLNPKKNNI